MYGVYKCFYALNGTGFNMTIDTGLCYLCLEVTSKKKILLLHNNQNNQLPDFVLHLLATHSTYVAEM